MPKLHTYSVIFAIFVVCGLYQSIFCREFESNEAKLAYRTVSAKEWDFLNKDPLLDYRELLLQKGTKVNLRLCSSGNLLKAISKNLRELLQVQSYVRNRLKFLPEQFLISYSKECIKRNGKMSLIEIWVSPQNSEIPKAEEIIQDCQLNSIYKVEKSFKDLSDFTNELPNITQKIKNNPQILGIIRSYSLNNREIKSIQSYFLENGLSANQFLIQNLHRRVSLKDKSILLVLAKLRNKCIAPEDKQIKTNQR